MVTSSDDSMSTYEKQSNSEDDRAAINYKQTVYGLDKFQTSVAQIKKDPQQFLCKFFLGDIFSIWE